MYPGSVARTHGEKVAVAIPGGGSQTYRELDERSARLAAALTRAGLGPGDTVAIVLENRLEWIEAVWGPMRSGRWVAPLNWHLGRDELAYLLKDSRARGLITSAARVREFGDVIGGVENVFALDADYEDALAAVEPQPIEEDKLGARLLYSSGSTGRPKGIRAAMADNMHPAEVPPRLGGLMEKLSFDSDVVFLNAAPCYHAAPFVFTLNASCLGATTVHLERFDAEEYLAAIEAHGVTHAQAVPTMFVRLLRLPAAVRSRYDLSSLRVMISSGAPCAPSLKTAMAEWLGPVMHEYYGASEGYGVTHVSPEEAAARPGTVGRPVHGTAHITDDGGNELSPRQIGTVWFGGMPEFRYDGDEEKSRRARNDRGWATVGDIGFLDEDGFLYLTGRTGHTIISGGVNIYPQEIEDVLLTHPAVVDVAVFGLPDVEYGERVTAVVQLDPALSPTVDDLVEHVRAKLARFKAPRQVEFLDELPRLPSGKLNKTALRERYLATADSMTNGAMP